MKCIYIDPPDNTGSAFEHYDDNLEHSQWLAMMWPRLELLRELLAKDGSIWASLDDREGFSGHSCRAGLATSAIKAGVPTYKGAGTDKPRLGPNAVTLRA